MFLSHYITVYEGRYRYASMCTTLRTPVKIKIKKSMPSRGSIYKKVCLSNSFKWPLISRRSLRGNRFICIIYAPRMNDRSRENSRYLTGESILFPLCAAKEIVQNKNAPTHAPLSRTCNFNPYNSADTFSSRHQVMIGSISQPLDFIGSRSR